MAAAIDPTDARARAAGLDGPLAAVRARMDELAAADDAIAFASARVEATVMLPLGRRATAFVPGRLVHTGEVLCPLGAGYMAWRTTAQARALIDRQTRAAQRLEDRLLTAVLAPATVGELIADREAASLASVLRSLGGGGAGAVDDGAPSHVDEVDVGGGERLSYITETEEESWATLGGGGGKPAAAPASLSGGGGGGGKVAASAGGGGGASAGASPPPRPAWADAYERLLAKAAGGEESWDDVPAKGGAGNASGALAASAVAAAPAPATVPRREPKPASSAAAAALGSSPPAAGGRSVRFADADDVREFAPAPHERHPPPAAGAPAAAAAADPVDGPGGGLRPKPQPAAVGASAFTGRIVERKAPTPVAAPSGGAVTAAATSDVPAAAAAPRASRFKQGRG